MKLAYAGDDTKDNTEDGGGVQDECNPTVILKHAIMTITLDKGENKSKANHYHETKMCKLKKSSIIGSKEYNVMYDADESSINMRLRICCFLGMYLTTLQQIQ